MNFETRNSYIVCEPYKIDKINTNNLLVTSDTTDGYFARIIDDNYSYYSDLYKGDIIFYNKNNATELTIQGKKYIVIRKEDIYAKVEL